VTETLNQLLRRAAGFPETGLRFLDRREDATWTSWPEVHAAAAATAGGLRALGLERGERVALVYATGPEFFHAFFGVLLAGAVPVPLYPPVRLGRLDEYHQRTAAMLRAAGARLVLTEARLRRIAAEVKKTARRVNALQQAVIPVIRSQIYFIQQALDQQEQEDIFRLKRIKSKLEAKHRHRSAAEI